MYKKGDTILFDSGRQYLVKETREGGMGVVYICRKSKYGTGDWIFKTFKDEIFEKNKNIHNSFVNECKIWISLSRHPFIVEAKSIETINGQPFVEMGRIYSRNLSEAIFQYSLPNKILPAIRLASEICLAMIYANRKIAGFVHRDLKPSNIMIGLSLPFLHLYNTEKSVIFRNPAFERAWGQAAVSDFGLSKVAIEIQEDIVPNYVEGAGNKTLQFSKFGTVCGTPPYMSPEQCLGMPLDQRSDIYAFGCIFYEMLTGRLLFNANTAEDFIHNHIRLIPANVSLINPRISDEISNIVMKCLNKEPGKRYNTFTEIYETINRFINFEEKIDKIYSDIFKDVLYQYSNEQYISYEIYKLLESAYKLFQLGEDADAKRDLDKAKNLYPIRRGIYYFALVRFCFPIGSDRDKIMLQKIKDYVEIRDEIESLKKVIEIDPEYAPLPWSPYDQLYDKYMRIGKTEEAVAILHSWLSVDKNNPKVYNFLGDYYLQKGDTDKAIEYLKIGESLFREGDKHYPYSRGCGYHLSRLYLSLGKEELAIGLLEKRKYYRDLIDIYFDKSDLKLSFQYFEKYLEKEYESNKSIYRYKDDSGYENFNIDNLIRKINSREYIGDIGFGFKYSKFAFALEKESLLHEAVKIYRAILSKYLSIPPTKNKPRKNNYFRRYLPLMIKILEQRINMLLNKLKDLNIALLVVSGPMKGHAFVLKGLDEILIGREQGENIHIPEDSFVSRKHARIIFDDNNYFLEDLNSANGTCLNRSKIEKKTQISDGDIITIGHTDLKLSIGLNVKYIK